MKLTIQSILYHYTLPPKKGSSLCVNMNLSPKYTIKCKTLDIGGGGDICVKYVLVCVSLDIHKICSERHPSNG